MSKTLPVNSIFVLLVILAPIIGHTQTLLSGPQKIVIDSERNRLLVSNYNTGDIVEIDSLENQRFFIEGAGFVDGLEIVGNTIFGVGNNRVVRAYDLDTKQLIFAVTLDGTASNYLSSITSDSSGHLFISCPKLNEIYRMRINDQAYWIFAKDNGLVKPNGILLEKENNRIVVIDDSPGSSLIHAVSLLDSTVSTLASTSFDRPDGIVRDKYGCYYVGGYYLPGLYKFDPDFSQTPEMFFAGSHMVYPTYDESDHSLLVTYYNDNTWGRVPLTPTGIGQFKQPSEFIMYQVSPNPFKSLVTIKFELKKRALARMDVYDTIGVLLKTLMNDERGPGTYSMKWDGTDNTGNIVSDGTYYFILTVNGVSQTTKAILIK